MARIADSITIAGGTQARNSQNTILLIETGPIGSLLALFNAESEAWQSVKSDRCTRHHENQLGPKRGEDLRWHNSGAIWKDNPINYAGLRLAVPAVPQQKLRA